MWGFDFIDSLSGKNDIGSILDTLQMQIQKLEFSHCAYGIQFRSFSGYDKPFMMNTYPQPWQQSYESNRYFEIDPIIQRGRRSLSGFCWSAENQTEQRDFWVEAASSGIQHGYSQSCVSMSGNKGMLTISREYNPVTESEARYLGCRIFWLTQVTHQCVSELIEQEHPEPIKPELTPRERDVLGWTAEGKTAWETAIILSVSERTVTFHLANAMKKLGCTNKTSAAVKAACLGILNGY